MNAPTWPREAISDKNGLADAAYVSLFSLTFVASAVIFFMCGMSAYDYFNCETNCKYDPLPLAQAIALVCAAFFATGLGGLTAYMVATRNHQDGHTN